MQLALVTDTYFPDVNGVAMTLERLAMGLISRGHKVLIITPVPSQERDATQPSFTRAVVPHLPVPGYPGLRMGIPHWRQVEGLLLHHRIQAVYVATESMLGYSATRTCRRLKIPVLSGFHTNFHTYTEGYNIPVLQNAVMRYLRRLHNQTLCTFTPSNGQARELTLMGFERVKVLGRGVDSVLFNPSRRDESLRAEWGAGPDTPVAIVIGRIAAEKNLPLAVKAFDHLKKLCPDTIVVIVGDGPKLNWLKSENPHFHYAGMRSGEDLARHFASADLFIFPSLTETFGNVVMEALASGLVTVAFHYAAALQYIRSGENGFTAKFGDESDYLTQCAQALEHWRDPAIRERAQVTATGHSWNHIVEQFEQELHQAVADTMPVDQSIKKHSRLKKKLRFRAIFLSDVHLGTPDCKIAQVNHFLRHCTCEKLVLNGDIIDAWSLARTGKWTKSHTYFIRQVLKKMEKENTEVIYLRGNHDDILWRFLPMKFDNLSIVNEHIHEGEKGNYLVVHGDGFDAVTTNYPWLAHIGSVGYGLLLRLNRLTNWIRKIGGHSSFSLSKYVKAKVKQAVSFVSRYEVHLQQFAEQKGCKGIICGHIHTPSDKMIGDIHYLNSGDWVESLTAVVENQDRSFAVITYEEFCRRANREPKGGMKFAQPINAPIPNPQPV